MSDESPFRSARLIYRAVEETDDAFIHSICSDPYIAALISMSPVKPVSLSSSMEMRKHLMEPALLSVMICIPPEAEEKQNNTSTIPVGFLHFSEMKLPHRRTRVAIALAAPYQGKGYGIEALQWGLRFAFLSAGAHRVDLEAFGFNTHAMKAYEALGFIKEGALRECMFRDGKWEDFILYSMLEGEWRSRYSSSNQ